jgi:hypothetical protein
VSGKEVRLESNILNIISSLDNEWGFVMKFGHAAGGPVGWLWRLIIGGDQFSDLQFHHI